MKFLRLLIVLVVIALAAGVYLLDYDRPALPAVPVLVDIPAGLGSIGSTGIAGRLESAGVIRSRYLFLLQRRLSGGTLKAGVYRFDHPLTVLECYAHLARGDVYTLTLTIPEGFNLFDIAQAVQAAGLAPGDAFLRAARSNTHLVADLDPHATSLEGYLFPDTYRFSPHATPAQMLATMVHRFRQQAASLGLPPQPARVVTLASLIEKEVHLDAERPLVAGVFNNRLALNMPLATDPAVIYAALLANRWRGAIYQSDLQFDSPYNTYRHAGLPPGPICNPGLAALRAALHPAQTDYLYFVADASGSTRFSATLAEHNAQVAAYRQAAH